jgi:hypothetical protein
MTTRPPASPSPPCRPRRLQRRRRFVRSGAADASPLDPQVRITGAPGAPGCDRAAPTGTLYLNSEVEPHVAVNPEPQSSRRRWQQDRWSNGAARGLRSAVSFDAGRTWAPSGATFALHRRQRCEGATTSAQAVVGRDRPRRHRVPDRDWCRDLADARLSGAVLVARSGDGGVTRNRRSP